MLLTHPELLLSDRIHFFLVPITTLLHTSAVQDIVRMTSRQELIQWVNDLLLLNYTKVEQLGAGR